jgi:hypothetical protein
MTTMFSIHAQDTLTAALSAIEVGVDTSTGRDYLNDAVASLRMCEQSLFADSQAERLTMLSLRRMVSDLVYLTHAHA